jgi:hypothetical protein
VFRERKRIEKLRNMHRNPEARFGGLTFVVAME